MTHSPPGHHEESAHVADTNKWILDTMMIRDADFFSKHPDASEFYRPPFPLEIETLFPEERDLPYDEFRVLVIKVNEDTYIRRLLRRSSGSTVVVGLGVSTYPASGVANLQRNRCGGVCCR